MHQQLLYFYLGGTDDQGRTFTDIINKDFTWLEDAHDYIQWLFPTSQPSSYNRNAPILDAETLKFFKLPLIQDRVFSAFNVMIQFYGFFIFTDPNSKNEQVSINKLVWKTQKENWLHKNNHNHLRITRILKCLMEVGLDNEAFAFFKCLEHLYNSTEGKNSITPETFSFWRDTVLGA